MAFPTLTELREAHKTLVEWQYELRPVVRGYAGPHAVYQPFGKHDCRETRHPADERYLHGRQRVWFVAAVERSDRKYTLGRP